MYYLKVGQFGHSIGLDAEVVLSQLCFDLFQAGGDVLGLVLLVVPDPPDQVVQVLVKQTLQVAFHFHQSHFGCVKLLALLRSMQTWTYSSSFPSLNINLTV